MSRTAGAAAVLATVVLGIRTVAGAQLATVIVVLTVMLLADTRRPTAT